MAVGPVGGGKPRPVVAPDVSSPATVSASTTSKKPDAARAPQDVFAQMAKTLGNLPGAPLLGPILKGAGAIAGAIAQAAKDGVRLAEMKDLLKGSPTGAAAVKYLEDKNIPIEFANGGGSYWDGSKIVIDRSKPMDRNALSLVHEINHAKGKLEGTSVNIATASRADYVAGELKEEVQGTVDSIKAKNELKAGGKTITASYPLEAEYNQAFKKASDDLKAKNPSATPTELKAAGEKAGSERVMKGFKDGEVRTSTNHKPYPEYYGTAWDKHHN